MNDKDTDISEKDSDIADKDSDMDKDSDKEEDTDMDKDSGHGPGSKIQDLDDNGAKHCQNMVARCVPPIGPPKHDYTDKEIGEVYSNIAKTSAETKPDLEYLMHKPVALDAQLTKNIVETLDNLEKDVWNRERRKAIVHGAGQGGLHEQVVNYAYSLAFGMQQNKVSPGMYVNQRTMQMPELLNLLLRVPETWGTYMDNMLFRFTSIHIVKDST